MADDLLEIEGWLEVAGAAAFTTPGDSTAGFSKTGAKTVAHLAELRDTVMRELDQITALQDSIEIQLEGRRSRS
jgi:hypothetical protein